MIRNFLKRLIIIKSVVLVLIIYILFSPVDIYISYFKDNLIPGDANKALSNWLKLQEPFIILVVLLYCKLMDVSGESWRYIRDIVFLQWAYTTANFFGFKATIIAIIYYCIVWVIPQLYFAGLDIFGHYKDNLDKIIQEYWKTPN